MAKSPSGSLKSRSVSLPPAARLALSKLAKLPEVVPGRPRLRGALPWPVRSGAPAHGRSAPDPMRSFAPHRLGRYECDAWVAYYRREWGRFLQSSLGMVHEGFGMDWPRTVQGAYLVLRANQLWAPYPDNDPDGARRLMRRFYALVASQHGIELDVDRAAELEVQWWRVHRYLQRESPDGSVQPLTDALAALYAHVYGVGSEQVREAAELRAQAMVVSDRWVDQGCDLGSALLVDELTGLVRSYGSLRAAVA